MQFFFREQSPRTASVLVFASSSIWGLMWVPMRFAETLGLPPLWVQFWFAAMPALLLGVFFLRQTLRERRHWPVYASAGFFVAAGFTFYAVGLLLASVSKTTALFYLTPIWATVFGYYFLGEIAGVRRLVAITLALVGCCLVMQINPFALNFEAADLLGFLSGLFWGAGVVILRRFPEVDFRNVTFVQYLFGAGLVGVAILVLDVPKPSATAVFAVIPVAFVFGALLFMPTMLLVLRISQYMSPGRVSILMLSEILVAVVSAMLFLGEILSLAQWIGVMTIVGAGLAVALEGARQPVEKPASVHDYS